MARAGDARARRVSPCEKSSSHDKGVTWDASRNLWKAHIKSNDTMKNLGRFRSEEEAALAYDHAAITLFGIYATLQFPPTGDAS